jgi:hypothetical protein
LTGWKAKNITLAPKSRVDLRLNYKRLATFKKVWGFLLVLQVVACASAYAEDLYYRVPLDSLTLSDGKLSDNYEWRSWSWQVAEALRPYVIMDGSAEAYVSGEGLQPWTPPDKRLADSILMIRAEKGSPITGRVFVPKRDLSGMEGTKFKIEPSAEKAGSKKEFFKAKEDHYRQLRGRNIPGGAWFRHQEMEAAKVLGEKALTPPDTGFSRQRMQPWSENGYDSTYELFSGGRALSENLQLDRALVTPGGSNAMTVALSSLTGITVREMNWKPLIHDPKPALDALAANIPFDQHAIFFSSFDAMTRWIQEADEDGTPILQIYEPRAEDANSRGRYQRQLCLALDELSRLIGPKLITGIAFTGSDPYLRTGTDVGIVYQATSGQTLKMLIQGKHAAAQQADAAAKAVKGDIAGVSYTGVVSPDRTLSSYVAGVENVVFVSNSKAQLERLISVAKGKTPALATQDDYIFFRQKYPTGAADETGFMVLSDAAIRRWCGPQWRIANSRRTRASAGLAELEAEHLDELISGHGGTVITNMPELGQVTLTRNGVLSSTFGTLEFLTPIIEMPMEKVTQAEADAYNRWRNGYQQNWSQVFDPIAVRFSMQPKRLSADVCVTPLIAASEYRQFFAVSRGAQIKPSAGDPHAEALVHLAVAINSQSEPVKESGNFLSSLSPTIKANPLGWLGECVAIYADQDPFWAELGKAKKVSEFLEKNYPRLPIAAFFEVKNPLGLAVFLGAVRAYAEQTAPGTTVWENLDYDGHAYVKVSANQGPREEGSVTNLFIYYAVTPNSLVVTLNEAVLKRALDRHKVQVADTKSASKEPLTPSEQEREKKETGSISSSDKEKAALAKGKDAPLVAAKGYPWLGTNVCLRIDQSFVPMLEALFREEFHPAQQRLAWSNLPILNEWKRRYPKEDPVKLHEQYWQTKLVCPGSGHYVWNEEWQTMESTVYGHPGQPKPGSEKASPVANITSANLGLTFENDGLSGRVVLERNPTSVAR